MLQPGTGDLGVLQMKPDEVFQGRQVDQPVIADIGTAEMEVDLTPVGIRRHTANAATEFPNRLDGFVLIGGGCSTHKAHSYQQSRQRDRQLHCSELLADLRDWTTSRDDSCQAAYYYAHPICGCNVCPCQRNPSPRRAPRRTLIPPGGSGILTRSRILPSRRPRSSPATSSSAPLPGVSNMSRPDRSIAIPFFFLVAVLSVVVYVTVTREPGAPSADGEAESPQASADGEAKKPPPPAMPKQVDIGATPDDDETGFVSIFNGQDLTGWEGDERFWSVEDGVIVGQSTPDNLVKVNTFLIWRDGVEVDDFELRFSYRVDGNSGVQYRSEEFGNYRVRGYQADFESGDAYAGILYDEGTGRGALALRGQRTFINEEGRWNQEGFASPEKLGEFIKKDDWNDYTIIAIGDRFIHKINGVRMSEVIDRQRDKAKRSGILAIQMHSGPAMKVEVKNLRIKRRRLADAKKIVLVAGGPSHGYGAHEHNAGVKLLVKRLNAIPGIHAVGYHHNGWPRDVTAFDNADAIFLYMDGGDSHPVSEHIEQVEKLTRRGVGLMCLHYAVHVSPGVPGEHFKKWLGGYYETGWSTNPHWDATVELNTAHPVSRGIEPFQLRDEWYFNMRFREGMQGVVPVLSAKPDKATREGPRASGLSHIQEAEGRVEHIMWAVDRIDGGRGVGCTGGHVHSNWQHDGFRNLILNALVWVAGGEVAENGVQSEPVSQDEIDANQDYPKPEPEPQPEA
ncbi:MAG: DUF1080 domain-containing protein [Planctomycetota bacterium]|nr:MAG: DUF1080 domain-containing protein [Planctomycetota bacterium]